MIDFIKFGLKVHGALFPICELFFLMDLTLIILRLDDVWTWIGIVLLGLYNVVIWNMKNIEG